MNFFSDHTKMEGAVGAVRNNATPIPEAVSARGRTAWQLLFIDNAVAPKSILLASTAHVFLGKLL